MLLCSILPTAAAAVGIPVTGGSGRELRFCRLLLDLDLPKLQPISETIHSRNPNTSRHVNVSQLISSTESKIEIGTQEQVIFSLNDHKYKAASGNANALQKAGANRVVQRGLRENDPH